MKKIVAKILTILSVIGSVAMPILGYLEYTGKTDIDLLIPIIVAFIFILLGFVKIRDNKNQRQVDLPE
jgi:hypothetical protein